MCGLFQQSQFYLRNPPNKLVSSDKLLLETGGRDRTVSKENYHERLDSCNLFKFRVADIM